jgi:ubiquinone/menaquinone biosynthesis C-methylase UbiE
MSIYEDKSALPFDVYGQFLEIVKKSDESMHRYLGDLGILTNDEETYKNFIHASTVPKVFNRENWEAAAKGFRFAHLVTIDSFCSELKFLSDRVVKEGVILYGGCGNGDIMEWVRRNTNAEVIGVDYSRKMLKEYKNKFKADIILGSGENIPLKDESVNQVILNGVRPLTSDRKLLSEAYRVVVPGGEIRANGFQGMIKNFPHLVKDIVDYVRKSDYEESIKSFIKNIQQNHHDLIPDMEAAEYCEKDIQDLLAEFLIVGLEPNYEFSRFPVLSRGSQYQLKIQFPVSIVSNKPKV